MQLHLRRLGVILAALLLAACPKNNDYVAYALTSTGALVAFKTNSPAKLTNSVQVTGLPSGESVVFIRYRPADQLLYGITSANQLCEIDPVNGSATLVSSAPFDPGVLSDAIVAVDPVADQLRVMATEANLRISPVDGSLQAVATLTHYPDGDVNFGMTPQLVGAAYDPATSGASSATLYGLDATTQSLVQVGDRADGTTASADTGVLHTIGSLGIVFGSNTGFDIESRNGDAFAALAEPGAASALYAIDLGSGGASLIGTIGDGNLTIISLALLPDQQSSAGT